MTEAEKVRDRINHGGTWDGRAVWQERMGRPSAAELKYLPRGTWSGWVSSAKALVDDRIDKPMVRLILGVPPWPTTSVQGSWTAAARGDYAQWWTGFWRQLARLTPDQRGKVIIRFWEFNGGWYPWTILSSGKVSASKAKNMAVSIRRFFDLGDRICGDDRTRYDHNLSGGMGTAQVAQARQASWPGDDYVDRSTIDRYVSAQDARNPNLWSASLADLVNFADAHDCTPGITEGSFYQHKVKDGVQVGGMDRPGAVECLKRTHALWTVRAKEGRPIGDIMLFERDPDPEGWFSMFTLKAEGTRPKQGDSAVRFPNGKSYPTHCPRLIQSAIGLGWVGPAGTR